MVGFHLAPELPSLSGLGVNSAEQLLYGEPPHARARVEHAEPTYERLRIPLPGTPSAPGEKLTEAPAGAGTGWVILERWRRVPLRELLGLRFGNPRSVSVAQRHWNLLCHLRANGVGTPEPWAVGARGVGLVARDSFLVSRAIEEGTLRLDRFIAGDEEGAPSGDAVRHAAAALAVTLRALFDAGAVLPRLAADGLWLRFSSHSHEQDIGADEDPGCGLAQLATWRADRALGGLRRDPRPAVLVSNVFAGRLVKSVNAKERLALIERIEASLTLAISGEGGKGRRDELLAVLRDSVLQRASVVRAPTAGAR